jgi:hypothetical protein
MRVEHFEGVLAHGTLANRLSSRRMNRQPRSIDDFSPDVVVSFEPVGPTAIPITSRDRFSCSEEFAHGLMLFAKGSSMLAYAVGNIDVRF